MGKVLTLVVMLVGIGFVAILTGAVAHTSFQDPYALAVEGLGQSMRLSARAILRPPPRAIERLCIGAGFAPGFVRLVGGGRRRDRCDLGWGRGTFGPVSGHGGEGKAGG